MNRDDFVDAIGKADDDMVEKVGTLRMSNKKKSSWGKWAAAAACIAVVMVAILSIPHGDRTHPVSIGGVMREYTNASVKSEEISIVWPWEYKTVYEKYTHLNINDVKYLGSKEKINETHIGEIIGPYEVIGYDSFSDGIRHEIFDVYEITNIAHDRLLAVKMGADYYVFRAEKYDPPTTFGEVLKQYNLSNVVELSLFTSKSTTNSEPLLLTDDTYIWKILNSCADANAVNPIGWHETKRTYIDFSVTSEVLGVRDGSLYITDDGYIGTDIFNGEYLYYIGEERAANIISYAEKNAVKAEQESYMYSLAGTLTEIGDGYILVDDSILCSDAKDGMVFKILTTNQQISRYIDCKKMEVGSILIVYFTEPVLTEAGNLVDSAVSMDKGYLFDGSISVEE